MAKYDDVSPGAVHAGLSDAFGKAVQSALHAPTQEIYKQGASTAIGGSRTLETLAEREDAFINGMIDLLSSMSEEDANRVLLKIQDGLKLAQAPVLVSGKQVGVAKAGIGFPKWDAAFDALMAHPQQTAVSKAAGPTPWLDRGRWQ
jgi:hypothetical protein